MLKYLLPLLVLFLFFRSFQYKYLTINLMFLCLVLVTPSLVGPFVNNGVFLLDELSAGMIMLSFWISGLMLLASDGVLKGGLPSFIGWVLSLCIALVTVFSSSGLVMFYIFFEASLIPVTVMVLGWGYQPERLQASGYLVLYTVGASLPLLVSIIMMFLNSGHTSFFLILWLEPIFYNLNMWWLMSILAFMVKTPLYFVHLWLPKAHVEAPVAGSMVLAGLLLKLGGFGMLRLTVSYQFINVGVSCFFSGVALWGGFICGLICLRQTDMKALIAYSSVTHMGVMVGGIMSNSVWGWQGALLMMIAHGLVSSSMFAGANLMYQMFSSRSIFFVKGVMSVVPVVSFLWFLSLSANMGVPPTINLQGEIMLIGAILSMSSGYVFPIFLSLFFSAAYSLLLYSSTQNGAVGELSNVFNGLSFRASLLIFLHLIPVFLLVLKSEMIISWVV